MTLFWSAPLHRHPSAEECTHRAHRGHREHGGNAEQRGIFAPLLLCALRVLGGLCGFESIAGEELRTAISLATRIPQTYSSSRCSPAARGPNAGIRLRHAGDRLGPGGPAGGDPGGQAPKKVGIVERKAAIGGVSVNTGTIPSKTLREAVLHLSSYRERAVYGASYSVKQNISMGDLLFRTEHVIRHEIDIIRHQLSRNG